jgi:uncharacterized membrane protein
VLSPVNFASARNKSLAGNGACNGPNNVTTCTCAPSSLLRPQTLQEKSRRSQHRKNEYPIIQSIENDEDKIIRLLKSAGGSLYQSAIAEQSRFSRVKTSNLLASLENKGIIKRYKKGRDKIVTLTKAKENNNECL